MADVLIIVDSPAKKIFFEGYYTGDVEVFVSSMPVAQPTHKETGGGATGSGTVAFSLSPTKTGQEVANKLQEYREKNIIVALDTDPRSEYLSWLISKYVKQISKGTNTVKRLNLSGVKTEEVKEAFDFVSVVDETRGVEFYTRSLFDSYVSSHLTRLIGTSRGPGNFPLQYSSLSTIFLLSDREMEIQMFRPMLKWQIKAELSFNGHFLDARLEEVCDVTNDGFLKDEKEAMRVHNMIKDDPFVVEKIERTSFEIEPPPPYMILEIMHDALVLYEIGPKDTLSCLRKLFHGVTVDGKITGVISSFASLENAKTTDWITKLKNEVVSQQGEQSLGSGTVEPVTGMIFPLLPDVTGAQLSDLSENDRNIYELIRGRALASQMKSVTGEVNSLEISAGPEAFFTSQFRTVDQKGFLEVYLGRYDKSLLSDNPLAEMAEEQVLNTVKVAPEQTGGMPAEHYTIETLFVDLADFSIAPDPVNIFMLQGMINAGYIVISHDGFLKTGENLKKVTAILAKAFPHMQGINLSAYIEQTVAEAVSGRKGLDFSLKQFHQTLMSQGRPLVKAKVPTKVKPRVRRSSTIIKQVADEKSESEVKDETLTSDSSQEVQAAQDASTETEATESLVQQETEQNETAETAPEVTPSEDVSTTVDQQEAQAETGSEETGEQPENEEVGPVEQETDTEEVVPEAMLAETMDESAYLADAHDQWPDELKEAFESALEESSSTAEASQDVLAQDGAQASPTEKVLETDQEHSCQVCGKTMLLKEDRFGKFWSCSGFPACRHTEAFNKDAQDMYCPICREGKITNKRTPAGKPFFVCMDEECEFMSWAQPHYVSCKLCDSSYLVEKKAISGKVSLRCPKAGCDYSQPLGKEVDNSEEPKKPAKRKVRVRRKAGSAPLGKGGGKKKVRIVRRKKK